MDEIYQHTDNHDKVLGIYLDLQKAFYLNYNTIYGIRGMVQDWLKSYLRNGTQFVYIK